MTVTDRTTVVGAHLVGSLPAANADSAMRMAAAVLGHHVNALTDGETGDRRHWVVGQLSKLASLPGIEVDGVHGVPGAHNVDYRSLPALSVAGWFDSIPPGTLGYARAAAASYDTFQRLRTEGTIPAGVKFQVSLPTPYAAVVMFVREDDQRRFLDVYTDALAAEVAEIVRTVPTDDLLVQYDLAAEIGTLTGQLPAAPPLADKTFLLDSLCAAFMRIPEDVDTAAHLCCCDLRGRHFITPRDLSLFVQLANALAGHCDLAHIPADRDAGRHPSYYEPLRDLVIPRLALGVVDPLGDGNRTAELLQAATAGAGRGLQFAIATECGMSRITEQRSAAEHLLRVHAEYAAPIR